MSSVPDIRRCAVDPVGTRPYRADAAVAYRIAVVPHPAAGHGRIDVRSDLRSVGAADRVRAGAIRVPEIRTGERDAVLEHELLLAVELGATERDEAIELWQELLVVVRVRGSRCVARTIDREELTVAERFLDLTGQRFAPPAPGAHVERIHLVARVVRVTAAPEHQAIAVRVPGHRAPGMDDLGRIHVARGAGTLIDGSPDVLKLVRVDAQP